MECVNPFQTSKCHPKGMASYEVCFMLNVKQDSYFSKKNEFKIKIESEVRKGDFLPIGSQPIFPL